MNDWNPQSYLKFSDERTLPSADLAARIKIDRPAGIIDIGCGPGNSTRILKERWPGASITGLDNSPSMIERAKKEYPVMKWVLADAARIRPDVKYDIVFSNAAIQWIPDHERLIPVFFEMVKKGGALAVQTPMFKDMPLNRAIVRTAASKKWAGYTHSCGGLFTYHDAGFYYGILAGRAAGIEMWETSYIHVFGSCADLIEWSRSTAMMPYLNALPSDGLKKEFEAELLEECRREYPPQPDGNVLFPVRRLFFIAYG